MKALGSGLWIDTAPIRIVGTRLSVNMAAVRLDGGGLLLWSPLELTPERHAEVQALGAVEQIVAPNLFHHLHAASWAAAYPGARVHGAPGLQKKRADLRIDRVLGAATDADLEAFEEVPIDGFRLGETALFHRPSGTMLVADLVHNVGRPEGLWTKTYTTMAGFYDQVALSRVLRWTAFSDRAAARRSIDRLLAQPFERLLVGHGDVLDSGAREAFEGAYDWLAPSPRLLRASP